MQSFQSLSAFLYVSLVFVNTNGHSIQPRSSLQSSLFPPQYSYSTGYTTSSSVSLSGVTSVSLSDSALNVVKPASSQLGHTVVQYGGKTAWEASYPAGSFNPGNDPKGGFGFYLGGTDAFANAIARGAKEVIFSYSVMFEKGFQWNKGGKIPGGFGGIGSNAFGCSGGRQDGRQDCFDLRLMWRANGAGELYTYLPETQKNNDAQMSVPPKSIADSSYGYSVGRGSFTFPAGTWVTVAERIKLNDPTSYNGEVEIFVNGQSEILLTGVSMRNSADSFLQGMHFQTFFGGSSSDWASPQDQKAWFADVSGAIIGGGKSSSQSSTSTSKSSTYSSGSTTKTSTYYSISTSKASTSTKTSSYSFSTTRTSSTPSPTAKAVNCSQGMPWSRWTLYQPGAQVVYSNKLWKATNWSYASAPGKTRADWTEVASC